MKKLTFTLCVLAALSFLTISDTYAQQQHVWAVDFVQPKEGQRTTYLKFLEANWTKAREEAKRQGFIESYKLLTLPPSSDGDWEILLMTVPRREESRSP